MKLLLENTGGIFQITLWPGSLHGGEDAEGHQWQERWDGTWRGTCKHGNAYATNHDWSQMSEAHPAPTPEPPDDPYIDDTEGE